MLNLSMKAKTIQDHLQGDKNKNLQNIFKMAILRQVRFYELSGKHELDKTRSVTSASHWLLIMLAIFT